jgi:hypothetical protein
MRELSLKEAPSNTENWPGKSLKCGTRRTFLGHTANVARFFKLPRQRVKLIGVSLDY